MIKEIVLKVYTGDNIYITTWKFKQERANLFHNNKTPERYLKTFLATCKWQSRRNAVSL